MTEFTTTRRGDRIAFDRTGAGTTVVFVSGAGPFRAIDPITTQTANLLSEHGVGSVVYDRVGRGESGADGLIDLDRELAALASLIEAAGGLLCSADTPRGAR